MISLYFHIPFCTKKCPYCHFYVVKDTPHLKKRYLLALKKEWEEKKPFLTNKKIASIYFGGGTPSLLSSEEFSFIFSFFQNLDFAPDIEITLEANPETLTLPFLQHIQALGVNRISLGVQALDNSLLTTLGRTHDAHKAIRAIDIIQSAGIKNISIDLMYDLPGQSLAQFEKTLLQAVSLAITHISLYNLTIEPHTSFYRQKDKLKVPKDEESLAMLERAIDLFEKHGFARYEISAFSKKGFESNHNSGYWTGRSFLGYGPSAFSYWDNSRFSNIAHLLDYERLENRVGFSETLSPTARYKELLAVRLRLFKPFSLFSFSEPIPKDIPEIINHLIQEGYINKNDDTIHLTKKGTLFYDYVAETII